MVDARAIDAEVHARLRRCGRRERREFMSGYAASKLTMFGCALPDIRAIARDVSKRLRAEPAAAVLAVVEAILASATFEGRHVAFQVLAKHRPAFDTLTTRKVEALGRGLDNWALVDDFAGSIAGPAWREGLVTDTAVHRWARSKDRWWRRIALVSTVALNRKSRGGSGDTPRTVAVCRRLVDDRDEMVVKALSWALRDLSLTDVTAVRRFLREHESALASRVLREVRKKLATGKK